MVKDFEIDEITDEITEQQAVLIAKWVGFAYDFQYGWQHCELHKSLATEEIQNWLSSPEGEVAMIVKILQRGVGANVEFEHVDHYYKAGEKITGLFQYCAVMAPEKGGKNGEGVSKTLSGALIKAILEMLGRKDESLNNE